MSTSKEKLQLEDRNIRVLLLEDEEVDAIWFERGLKVFKENQFEISWVRNLKNCTEELREKKFDVIFADLKVDDADGLEIFDAIYEISPNTPIILISGNYSEEETAMKGLKKGAQDYLVKGKITHETLIRSLAYALERSKITNMKDNFLNIISHDLRTPIAVIKEAFKLVHEGLAGPVNDEQKKFLEMGKKWLIV